MVAVDVRVRCLRCGCCCRRFDLLSVTLGGAPAAVRLATARVWVPCPSSACRHPADRIPSQLALCEQEPTGSWSGSFATTLTTPLCSVRSIGPSKAARARRRSCCASKSVSVSASIGRAASHRPICPSGRERHCPSQSRGIGSGTVCCRFRMRRRRNAARCRL
jgi:hypothetical protein